MTYKILYNNFTFKQPIITINLISQVYLFNMCNGSCVKAASLHRKRSDMAVAVLSTNDRDNVYAIGGRYQVLSMENTMKTVERLIFKYFYYKMANKRLKGLKKS